MVEHNYINPLLLIVNDSVGQNTLETTKVTILVVIHAAKTDWLEMTIKESSWWLVSPDHFQHFEFPNRQPPHYTNSTPRAPLQIVQHHKTAKSTEAKTAAAAS